MEFVEGMLQDALCDGGALCVRVLSIGLCMCVSCVVCVSKVCVECVPGMYCVGVTVCCVGCLGACLCLHLACCVPVVMSGDGLVSPSLGSVVWLPVVCCPLVVMCCSAWLKSKLP